MCLLSKLSSIVIGETVTNNFGTMAVNTSQAGVNVSEKLVKASEVELIKTTMSLFTTKEEVKESKSKAKAKAKGKKKDEL